MIPFDQTVEYNFGAPGNAIAVQFQLTMGGGQNLGGYNMVAVEKINYIVPAGTPPDFNGGWGGDPVLLNLAVSGIITDQKGLRVDGWKDIGLGMVFMKYTQTIGVAYRDWCDNVKYSSIGTVTVTHTRSATNFDKWVLSITQP